MDKFLKSRINEKPVELTWGLEEICRCKKIEVINEHTFVLNNRELILDYHFLTEDYKGIIKNLLRGRAILNKAQLQEYQRKDFVKAFEGVPFRWDDYGCCCNDMEH